MRIIKIKSVLIVLVFILLIISFSDIIKNSSNGKVKYDNYLINDSVIYSLGIPISQNKSLIESIGYTPSSFIPFWFWNGNITKDELIRQIELMKSIKVNEVIIHARSGLYQEYLSEEWFELFGFSLSELRKNDIKVWIYDEFDWPSGIAGGKVLENNPSLIAKNLKIIKIDGPKLELPLDENFKVQKIISVIFSNLDKNTNLKDAYCTENQCFFGDLYKNNSIYVFYQDFGHFKTEYKKEYYVDLLNKETTAIFINLTHEEYYKRFKGYFGNTIVGFFTDEPGFYSNVYDTFDIGSIPWTDDFDKVFYKKKGYNITDYVYFLWYEDESETSKKLKIDYFQVRNDLYINNYFKTLNDWTKKNNVLLTGHVLIEENLYDTILFEGDFFRAMEYLDIPGTDDIIEFDKNKITPILASSAEFIYNKPYSLTEVFAGYGWDLDYKEVLEVSEWLYNNGIDIIVLHSFFYTTKGYLQFKDYPPSFFYQNDKLWPYMENYVDYTEFKFESSKNITDFVFIKYPIKEAWSYFNPNNSSKVDELDKDMKKAIDYYRNKGKRIILVPDYMLY